MSVSGQYQVSLWFICPYFVCKTEPKILRLVLLKSRLNNEYHVGHTSRFKIMTDLISNVYFKANLKQQNNPSCGLVTLTDDLISFGSMEEGSKSDAGQTESEYP